MSEHTPGEVHLLPPTDPNMMLVIVSNESLSLMAYVGAKGLPNEANARRIVALWNACRGITTKQLEIVTTYESDESRLSWLGWSANYTARHGHPPRTSEQVSASDVSSGAEAGSGLKHPSHSPFALQRT